MQPVNIEVIKKAINGDKIAFSEIISERKLDVFRLAYGYMKNENDAMDILGDTVYRAFIYIRKLKKPEYFNTWLAKIVINCSINTLKKRGKISKKEVLSFSQNSDDKLDEFVYEDSTILRIDIENAIDKLSLEDKTIILLKYFEDLTIVQISEVLSCPVGTVKTHLNRALKALRKDNRLDGHT